MRDTHSKREASHGSLEIQPETSDRVGWGLANMEDLVNVVILVVSET